MKSKRIGGLAVALGGLLWCLAGTSMAPGQEPPKSGHEITLTAKDSGFEPDSITVKKGEKVRLIATAADCDHEFKLEAFDISQALAKGDPAIIEFTADKAGTFEFKSSVYCGRGHRKMKGKLVVEE